MTMTLTVLLEKAGRKLKHVGMNPIVQQKAFDLVRKCYERGVYVAITQAFRTKEEQDELYAQGRTEPGKIVTQAKGGESYHNYGLAVDFALYTRDGKECSWSEIADYDRDGVADWTEVLQEARRLGFELGADWKGFRDSPHLQIAFGLSINDLKRGKLPLPNKDTVKPSELGVIEAKTNGVGVYVSPGKQKRLTVKLGQKYVAYELVNGYYRTVSGWVKATDFKKVPKTK